ncbi:Man1-Src1p-C-terminal domain-containing protein [Paraphysoderma sedebokerense]|nr:Man1-Src1p-C-terminal domain-containing protein [Paraphysoderma sedebokerense]
MASPQDLSYLEADFDYSKLTIQKLRSILSFHDVPLPPSSVKKQVLLDLFKLHIAANRDRIRESLLTITVGNEDDEANSSIIIVVVYIISSTSLLLCFTSCGIFIDASNFRTPCYRKTKKATKTFKSANRRANSRSDTQSNDIGQSSSVRKSDTSTTRRKTRRSAITNPKSIQNNRDSETDPDVFNLADTSFSDDNVFQLSADEKQKSKSKKNNQRENPSDVPSDADTDLLNAADTSFSDDNVFQSSTQKKKSKSNRKLNSKVKSIDSEFGSESLSSMDVDQPDLADTSFSDDNVFQSSAERKKARSTRKTSPKAKSTNSESIPVALSEMDIDQPDLPDTSFSDDNVFQSSPERKRSKGTTKNNGKSKRSPRSRISTPPEGLDLGSDNSLDRSPVDFTTYQSSNQSFDQSEMDSPTPEFKPFSFLDTPLAFQTMPSPFPPSQSSVDSIKMKEPSVLTSLFKIVRRISTASIALVVLYIMYYAYMTYHLGYCSSHALRYNEPITISSLVVPSCRPCPPHSYCKNGSVVSCENDYVLQENRLFRVLGASPSCQPDTQKRVMVDYLVRKVVERLDHFVGLKECGEEGYKEFYTVWDYVVVQVGSNPVSSSTSISSSLKQSGANNDTATSRTLRIGATIDSKTEKLKYTSLKPIHPFLCALRLSLIAFVIGNYQVISLLLFFFAATYSIFTKYRKRRLHNMIVEQLTQKVIKLLINQSRIYESSSSSSSSSNQYPSIGTSQLRDHLLPPTTKSYSLFTDHPTSTSRSKSLKPSNTVSVPLTAHDRLEIWRKVSKAVLVNSSIRETVMNYKGEALQMWEWIGPKVFEMEKVGQVDDSHVGDNGRRNDGDKNSRSNRVEISGGSGVYPSIK